MSANPPITTLAHTTTLIGIDAIPTAVRCTLDAGGPLRIVGCSTVAAKEIATRLRGALAAYGRAAPACTVTLDGGAQVAMDLAVAAAVLIADIFPECHDEAEREIPRAALEGVLLLGELAFDGRVRPVRGVTPACLTARTQGMRAVIVPTDNIREALAIEGITVYTVDTLGDLIDHLTGELPLEDARRVIGARLVRPGRADPDMADVRGNPIARRGLEIAAAGGHGALLEGPPGIGKTMLARRLPTILPPPTAGEQIEILRVYSATYGAGQGLYPTRPFRAPHYTISTAALLGGGAAARPGELSLAHRGVLFLDELPEFRRAMIDGIRAALHDGEVRIWRAGHPHAALPCATQIIASANPCPCGYAGSDVRCTCKPDVRTSYRARVAYAARGLLQLRIPMQAVTLADLRDLPAGEASQAIRARVEAARARQAARLAPWGAATNAQMPNAAIEATCVLDAAAQGVLDRAICDGASGIDVRRVARTIADLAGADTIALAHLAEALTFSAA